MPVFPSPNTGIKTLPSSRTLLKVKERLASRLSSVVDFSVFI